MTEQKVLRKYKHPDLQKRRSVDRKNRQTQRLDRSNLLATNIPGSTITTTLPRNVPTDRPDN